MLSDAAFDEADLNAYVDGRLDPARAAALAESLASDPEGRSRIDGWRRQNDSLRTMFASVLFEPIPVRLMPTSLPVPEAASAIAARAPPLAAAGAPHRLTGAVATLSIGMALVGFVAGVLASLGTDGFGLQGSGAATFATRGTLSGERPIEAAGGWAADRALANRASEAYQTFLTDLVRPVEITAGEEPRLLRWIQHRLGAPLSIPDLQRQGWTLTGGRVLPARGGSAAFLVYAGGPDRLGLYVSRTQGGGSGPPARVFEGGDQTSVAVWNDDGFGYALATARSRDWLEKNVEALRGGILAQMRERPAEP